MDMEVVGLEAINNRRNLAYSSIFEFEDGRTGGVIFVSREGLALAPCRVAHDLRDRAVHAIEESVERVAARCQQAAPSEILFDVPFELPVPRSDPVVVVYLAVVQFAEESIIDHGSGQAEVGAESDLKAYARLDSGFFDRGAHRLEILVVQG